MLSHTVCFYEVRALCDALCAELRRHGSLTGACLHVGISPQTLITVERRGATLPLKLVDALGLLPVKAVHTAEIVGYIAQAPVDLASLWA